MEESISKLVNQTLDLLRFTRESEHHLELESDERANTRPEGGS